MEKAIACSPYREAIEAAGGSLQTLLIRLEDEEGNKQDAIFLARVGLGGETIPFTVTTETGSSFEVPFFFYSDSKDAFFAPPGQGDTDKPGVLLPIRAWVEGETGYWAFRIETSNATQPLETDSYLFRRDFRTGIVTLREPYSGREYQWKENPQQTTSAMYRVISQSTLMPEGWVDVNGTPVSPEFLSLQEEIAQSENFTLTPNGLEVKLSDGTIVEAAGVAVQPDGTLTITIDGQKKPVTEIEVADNQLLLKAAGGETYTFSQEGQLIPTYPISEAREFVPANDIEFVENLPDYNLKLAPDADREAIYWDIIVSHLGDVISKSKGMEANRAVYEEIIKDHPEWEGIGHSWDY
ncbi:MAG TPA: hypothetical protein VNK49_12345, partial [Anaerolineales bacterium]|nr:hypothetical protein [Anaerolineales bacterium]